MLAGACLACCPTPHVCVAVQVKDVFRVWEVRSNDVDIAVTPSSNKAFIHWHVRGVQKDTQQVGVVGWGWGWVWGIAARGDWQHARRACTPGTAGAGA